MKASSEGPGIAITMKAWIRTSGCLGLFFLFCWIGGSMLGEGVLAQSPAAADETTVVPPGENTKGKVHIIKIPKGQLVFEPALLRIKPGDTVIWVNKSEKAHIFASIPGAGTNDKEIFSPMVNPGGSWEHTFQNPGDYPYFCFIHRNMLGAIMVQAGEASGTLSPEEGSILPLPGLPSPNSGGRSSP